MKTMLLASHAVRRFNLTFDQLWKLASWGVLATDRCLVGNKRVSLEDLQALEKSGELDRVRKKYPAPPPEQEDVSEPEEGPPPGPTLRRLADANKVQLDLLLTTDLDHDNISIDPETSLPESQRTGLKDVTSWREALNKEIEEA